MEFVSSKGLVYALIYFPSKAWIVHGRNDGITSVNTYPHRIIVAIVARKLDKALPSLTWLAVIISSDAILIPNFCLVGPSLMLLPRHPHSPISRCRLLPLSLT